MADFEITRTYPKVGQPSESLHLENPTAVPRLKRVLTLRDLVYYGIVSISPIAPIPIFGVAQALSRGHALTTILIAGVAMVFTAISYGRMAALYPSAGSAYTYVGRGLNPHLGFLAGWAMSIDYLVIPMIAIIQATLAIQRLVPEIPYSVWAGLFALLITALNLRGIRTTARANAILLVCMFAIVGVFLILAIIYLLRLQDWHRLVSVQPFYDERTFSFGAVARATSFAALTYIGFDAVTTLAEDVENPRRNILLAVVLVCLFTIGFGGLQVYLAQRVWPNHLTYPNIETAFMDVSREVGGPQLFRAIGVLVIVSMLGAALAAQVAAARLLFSMGRDNVLPRKIFARLDPVGNNPTLNILIIGLLAFVGSLLFRLEQAGELINFGAFLAFMGVNLSALRQFYFSRAMRKERRLFSDALVPILGFLFCFAIWWHLPQLAMTLGGAWFLLGVAYSVYRTRGFRTRPAMIDFD